MNGDHEYYHCVDNLSFYDGFHSSNIVSSFFKLITHVVFNLQSKLCNLCLLSKHLVDSVQNAHHKEYQPIEILRFESEVHVWFWMNFIRTNINLCVAKAEWVTYTASLRKEHKPFHSIHNVFIVLKELVDETEGELAHNEEGDEEDK